MKNYGNEKGGVSIYVLITMLILIIVLMGIYNSVINKYITQLEIAQQIKSTYEEDVNNIDTIYNELAGVADAELIQKIENLIDAKLAKYNTSSEVSNKISTSAVGFPDYANRTVLTAGQEYTAEENMYIIMDFTGKYRGWSAPDVTINGVLYHWAQGVYNMDYQHSLTNIIPIKMGSVYKVEIASDDSINIYKVPMVY